MKVLKKNWRFLSLIGVFAMGFGVLIFRSYQLQLAPESRVAAIAQGQFGRELKIIPRRATIFDRNGRSLAVSVNSSSVFIDPAIIKNPKQVARELAEALNMNRSFIEQLIKRNKTKRFLWLKRQVTPSEERAIQTMDIRGVALISEYKRNYVLGGIGSSILGYVSQDGRGLAGFEASYEKFLAGEADVVRVKRDAKGRPLFEKLSNVSSRGGLKSAYLTINTDLQYAAEKHLSEAVAYHDALAGVAIVMNPKTGELLAVAESVGRQELPLQGPMHSLRPRLRSLSDPIEPGSVLKIFGVGEALNLGLVKENTILSTPQKVIRIGGKTINESEAKHERTSWSIKDLVKYSSNVAMVTLQDELGPNALQNVYERFGFGEKTGVDLLGESRGIFNRWSSKKKLEWATMSFGQGIALTPLQITTAFATIANGGFKVTPKIVKELKEGPRNVKNNSAAVFPRRQVWSDKTLHSVTSLLEGVVQEDATGRLAMVPGYRVAGKTGTAQKVDYLNGGYKKGAYWSSFVGFLPADNPEFVIYVMLDEPRKNHYYGGVVAAPVFSKIAQTALRSASISDIH